VKIRYLLMLGAGCIAVLLVVHVVSGRSELGVAEAIRVLTGTSELRAHEIIVWKYRLPRVLIGLVAGALLALSGVLLQAVMRNPLAEPSTTGVGSGAALGVVVSILLSSGQFPPPVAALLGAALAGIALFALGRRSLAVAGILIGAVLSAITSLLLVVDAQPMGVVLRWLIGSLNARTPDDWNQLWPWAVVLIPAGLLCASRANALVLGDTAATGLGVRPDRTRFLLLTVAVLAAATAITAAGAVAFVGLMAPHAARAVVGGDHRGLVPISMAGGAIALSSADFVAFSVSIDLPGGGPDVSGLPVGAVTALLGAPYLIWSIRKDAR
jgi:iron complex transport system permease protein